MPIYDYKARDEAGKLLEGQLEAQHPKEAADKLWQRKLLAISIREGRATSKSKAPSAKLKVRPKEVVLFTRQLATMLKAGLPIIKSL